MTQQDQHLDQRIRQRVLEAAIEILGRHGLTGDLLREAAQTAGYSLEQAQRFFQRNEDLVYALYLRIATDLESRVVDFPDSSTISERFHAAMQAKLALTTPYRATLTSLLGSLANPHHELGVLNEQTEMIRLRGIAVMSAVVTGAMDCPTSGIDALARSLYAAHLALMLLWSQDRSSDAKTTHDAIDRACKVLARGRPLLEMQNVQALLAKADGVFTRFLQPEPDSPARQIATEILRLIFRYRRLLPDAGTCRDIPCPQCFALHLPIVSRAVTAGSPIHLVLPAFPAKSPSPRKVLGVLPDMAEELALRFLAELCDKIQAIYAPGARLTICSDGHVFSDLVGVPDATVTEYNHAIVAMIHDFELPHLDTFGMSDVFDDMDFPTMRDALCAHYAESPSVIHDRVHSSPHQQAQFNGIHRFLTEDQQGAEPERSKTQIKNEAKERTYEVIRRSDAWGRLIAECFATSVRLSIHPQRPHSDKIGILLGTAQDTWLTPWHGVAVKQNNAFQLMHRHEAETLGAYVVAQNNQPYYFELPDDV